jgi:pyruvate ferredoxin oxidoreductase beta subunit
MKVAREFFKSPKEIPVEEYLVPGSPLCAGCGGLTTLRLMHKVLGEGVVIVNAAGCMTLLSTFPFTTLTSSWLYTTMASASAGAQGIRDALDVLKSKGKLTPEADLKVLVLAGDGSTYDMGLSPTSAAIHRGLDFWYLCYDNEAYGNTGFQLSSSSPEDSHTSTSIAEPQQHKKDIFDIWLAHHPAYVATVSAHESVDLAEKVRRSMSLTGPKLFLSLAVCPTGWGFEPELGDEMSHLAVETGLWPLKEAIAGKVRHTYIPNKFRPVAEYLEPQRRFRHLFQPQRNEAELARIQGEVDAYWGNVVSEVSPQTKSAGTR